MKKSGIIVMLFLLVFQTVKADEGMWLPLLIKRLDQRNLQQMGLQLTPEELYSANNSSLKDAIVSLGGFCTAEMVSDQGLMLTNHHCAYDVIQNHSAVGKNYLADGFWAYSRDQELPNEGLFARFLVRIEDVTARVTDQLSWDMPEEERKAKAAEIGKEIETEAIGDSHYDAQVKSFFEGNEYYLFVYETFRDVRLVGAPPSSIGKFGGDTDNWMWPRQTGDFALLRVYTAPDGTPAEYSPENIPFKPKHHLPISLDGVKEGDFTMTAGYPGSTQRYLTSYGIRQAIDLKNPTVVAIRRLKLDILDEDMNADEKIRIMYASKHAQIANYWKYFIGQTEQITNNKVLERKEKLEREFTAWVEKDQKRKEKYGSALKLIQEGYQMTDPYTVGNAYILEAGLLGADAVLFAFRTDRMIQKLLGTTDLNEKESLKEGIRSNAEKFFSEHHMPTDQKLFAHTMQMYYDNVPADQHPAFFKTVGKKHKGNFKAFAEKLYSSSIYTDLGRMNNFLNDPSEKKYQKDEFAPMANELYGMYTGIRANNAEALNKISTGMRWFVAGLREMNPTKEYPSDANSTMRYSFGTVKSYDPADAVTYHYYSTLEGVMAKEDPDNDEFIVPEKLKTLYENKDYGDYADEDGKLRVNFLSNNDITGGNSGSPVINGKGELVGIAFDGNWEAMSGDISFETEVQRTISVDIRYVMFIIDKFGGAKNLVDEMTLVKNNGSASADKRTKENLVPAE